MSSNLPEPKDFGPEWRFAAFEGALSATRDWLRSVEKALNALVDSLPLTEASAAWLEMKDRMKAVEQKVDETSLVAIQTKNAVVGSYDDSGTSWRPGIRERVESIDRKMESVDHKVDDANIKAESFVGLGRWAVGVLTTILVGLLVEMANNYFGWYGTARAAHAIVTGGH